MSKRVTYKVVFCNNVYVTQSKLKVDTHDHFKFKFRDAFSKIIIDNKTIRCVFFPPFFIQYIDLPYSIENLNLVKECCT